MRLPSENVLDVLHCVDFSTLLALQRAASGFFDVIRRNQSLLPRLRVFHLHIDYDIGALALRETVGTDNSIVLKSSTPSRFAEDIDYSFVRTSRDAIGTNFVHSASIAWTPGRRMWKQLDMRKLVAALPALRHVRALSIECGHPMNTKWSIDRELLERLVMKPFDNLRCLRLCDVDIRTDWVFLRNEWALRLRSLTVTAHVRLGEVFYESEYPVIDSSGQAEILEYCADFVHLPKGTSKLVRLVDWRIPREFLERLVKTVAECNDWLTVVVIGAPGFTASDVDYAHSALPSEYMDDGVIVTEARFSSCAGSHCVIEKTFPDDSRSIVVTNNPFVTSFSDTWELDEESF